MAQYNLAVMYSNCTGFLQDFTEAVRLRRLAANQGLALAQYNLALMYSNGTGVLQDYTEAGRLYQLAADQELAHPQNDLALMYYNGTGVSQDMTKTARLLKLAADQGHQALRDTLGQLAAACPAGTRVRITGLTAAAHLNSTLGSVVQLTKPLAAGRLAVRIDGQPKNTSLSWANVQRV